jgi:hypothetical protein
MADDGVAMLFIAKGNGSFPKAKVGAVGGGGNNICQRPVAPPKTILKIIATTIRITKKLRPFLVTYAVSVKVATAHL